MKNCIFCVLLFIALPGKIFAQQTYSIGLQLNPVINYSTGSVEGKGAMKPFSINPQLALNLSLSITDRLSVAPFFSLSGSRQSLVQNEFHGYLGSESYSYLKYNYLNLDGGFQIKYNLNTLGLQLVAGIAYNNKSLTAKSGGHRFRGTPNYNGDLGIEYQYKPYDFSTTINSLTPLIGIRRVSTINKIGVFEYGLLLHIPTKSMPQYEYYQQLYADKESFEDKVVYSSKQYLLECTIIYRLVNFDKNFKLIHPKRKRS